jgi:hypothetical protein
MMYATASSVTKAPTLKALPLYDFHHNMNHHDEFLHNSKLTQSIYLSIQPQSGAAPKVSIILSLSLSSSNHQTPT